jgi:hypothetical protein
MAKFDVGRSAFALNVALWLVRATSARFNSCKQP